LRRKLGTFRCSKLSCLVTTRFGDEADRPLLGSEQLIQSLRRRCPATALAQALPEARPHQSQLVLFGQAVPFELSWAQTRPALRPGQVDLFQVAQGTVE